MKLEDLNKSALDSNYTFINNNRYICGITSKERDNAEIRRLYRADRDWFAVERTEAYSMGPWPEG